MPLDLLCQKNGSLGQDRKPLIAKIPEMPADLQQHIEAGQDTAQTPEEEEANAEIRKAGKRMTYMTPQLVHMQQNYS